MSSHDGAFAPTLPDNVDIPMHMNIDGLQLQGAGTQETAVEVATDAVASGFAPTLPDHGCTPAEANIHALQALGAGTHEAPATSMRAQAPLSPTVSFQEALWVERSPVNSMGTPDRVSQSDELRAGFDLTQPYEHHAISTSHGVGTPLPADTQASEVVSSSARSQDPSGFARACGEGGEAPASPVTDASSDDSHMETGMGDSMDRLSTVVAAALPYKKVNGHYFKEAQMFTKVQIAGQVLVEGILLTTDRDVLIITGHLEHTQPADGYVEIHGRKMGLDLLAIDSRWHLASELNCEIWNAAIVLRHHPEVSFMFDPYAD